MSLARVVWDRKLNCLCLNLPTDRSAQSYILWFDFDEAYREDTFWSSVMV